MTSIGCARRLMGRHLMCAALTGRNVMLTASDSDPRGYVAKVADFGLARMCHGEEMAPCKTFGTISHLPPELLNDQIMSAAGGGPACSTLLPTFYLQSYPATNLYHSSPNHISSPCFALWYDLNRTIRHRMAGRTGLFCRSIMQTCGLLA
jgi:hypothetical protein